MKITNVDELEYVVYLISESKEDLKNRVTLQKKLKEIFKKISKKYDVMVEGCYKINLYCDNYNNYVINIIQNEQVLFVIRQVDVDIKNIKVDSFLYETSDYYLISKYRHKHSIFFLNDQYYLKLETKLNKKEVIYLTENTTLIYSNIDDIIKNSQKIN